MTEETKKLINENANHFELQSEIIDFTCLKVEGGYIGFSNTVSGVITQAPSIPELRTRIKYAEKAISLAQELCH